MEGTYSTDVDIHQVILKYAQSVIEFSNISSSGAQNAVSKQTLKEE